ncbi:putative ribonuclease H-like domain-containing protein, partial [Tanacetum coccineum]
MNSNYLRIVGWFLEFQEGTISTASICLKEKSPVCCIDHKYYSLVVTDDFSRFTWVFFLGTKDERYGILKDFITFIENQLTKKVKAIRCDNGTELLPMGLGSIKYASDADSATIPIKDGDPEAEHKMCIKYASDADYASDDDTPVNLHVVVDWELLPTGLGSINVFYRKDNSRKCFTSLREILHLFTRADLMTIYGRVMTFYQDKKAE